MSNNYKQHEVRDLWGIIKGGMNRRADAQSCNFPRHCNTGYNTSGNSTIQYSNEGGTNTPGGIPEGVFLSYTPMYS